MLNADDTDTALRCWKTWARASGLTWAQVDAGAELVLAQCEDAVSLDELSSWAAVAGVAAPVTLAPMNAVRY